jgi:hypothetical protein
MAAFILAVTLGVQAAEFSVEDTAIRPGQMGRVVVSGAINGEATFGVTVVAELVARLGAVGRLTFTEALNPVTNPRRSLTPAKPSAPFMSATIHPMSQRSVDIVQVGDPWPGVGMFTPFDTDRSGSVRRNGMVDDNGTYVPAPTMFSGPLVEFPIIAGSNARGVWDVFLTTEEGGSAWEGVPTTLHAGTVTVTPRACNSNADCDDRDACTSDICNAGLCRHMRSTRANCDTFQRPGGTGKFRERGFPSRDRAIREGSRP